MKYLIDNATFEKIYQVLMEIKGLHIQNVKRLRLFIEAIYYICRSGSPCRLLPFYYGDWRAIHIGVIKMYGRSYLKKLKLILTWRP